MTGQHSQEPDGGYPVIPPPPPAPEHADAAPVLPRMPVPPEYQAPWPTTPQPPYGTPQPPQYAGPRLPPPPVWGGAPGGQAQQPGSPQSAPKSSSSRWVTPAIVLAILAGIVVLVVLISSLLSISIFADGSQAPGSPVATTSAVPSDETDGAVGGITADPATIAQQLQAKIDDYRGARKNGSLWNRLERTDRNETAVAAYLFFLTDMQLAASWGIDASDAKEYAADANGYERKLLAGEPLGDDVHIEFETRTFDYDGATGEGGFTDN